MSELLDLMEKRGSVYKIGRNTEVPVEEVVDRLKVATQSSPVAFNIQTTRYVVISGEAHEKVWDIIYDAQKGAMDDATFQAMEDRFLDAKEGLGTVLLFESRDTVETMPTNPPRQEAYKQNNHGIGTYIVWLVLTELGLGATLQHHNIGYEEGYDKSIREYLDLPDDYELLAQMPFGSIETPAANKPRPAGDDIVSHVE